MKRIGALYYKIISPDNLYLAYLDARKGKRKKRLCYLFETNLSANIDELYCELFTKTYRPMPYGQFIVNEPKKRLIYAPHFRDIVVQHAIYRVVYAIFDKRLIDTTFACRIGYGTHKASDYIQNAMRQYSADLYYLQMDIRKYFYTINRDILQNTISRIIKDHDALELMRLYMEIPDQALGIPIGNLLSQLYAGLYLMPLDHYIKRRLHVKHYARYVDDIVMIGFTRSAADEYIHTIRTYLADHFGLTLSKWHISKISQGINMVGYRTWRSRRFIRKHSYYKFTRKIKQHDQAAVNSLLGHAKQTQSIHKMIALAEHTDGIIVPKGFIQNK